MVFKGKAKPNQESSLDAQDARRSKRIETVQAKAEARKKERVERRRQRALAAASGQSSGPSSDKAKSGGQVKSENSGSAMELLATGRGLLEQLTTADPSSLAKINTEDVKNIVADGYERISTRKRIDFKDLESKFPDGPNSIALSKRSAHVENLLQDMHWNQTQLSVSVFDFQSEMRNKEINVNALMDSMNSAAIICRQNMALMTVVRRLLLLNELPGLTDADLKEISIKAPLGTMSNEKGQLIETSLFDEDYFEEVVKRRVVGRLFKEGNESNEEVDEEVNVEDVDETEDDDLDVETYGEQPRGRVRARSEDQEEEGSETENRHQADSEEPLIRRRSNKRSKQIEDDDEDEEDEEEQVQANRKQASPKQTATKTTTSTATKPTALRTASRQRPTESPQQKAKSRSPSKSARPSVQPASALPQSRQQTQTQKQVPQQQQQRHHEKVQVDTPSNRNGQKFIDLLEKVFDNDGTGLTEEDVEMADAAPNGTAKKRVIHVIESTEEEGNADNSEYDGQPGQTEEEEEEEEEADVVPQATQPTPRASVVPAAAPTTPATPANGLAVNKLFSNDQKAFEKRAQTFEELGLEGWFKDLLTQNGYDHPLRFQQNILPAILSNKLHAFIESPKSTGKLTAVLLTLLAQIDFNEPGVMAMVVTPNDTMSKRVERTILQLFSEYTIHVASFTADSLAAYRKDAKRLGERFRSRKIVVGSASQMVEWYKLKVVDVTTTQIMCIVDYDSHSPSSMVEFCRSVAAKMQFQMQLIVTANADVKPGSSVIQNMNRHKYDKGLIALQDIWGEGNVDYVAWAPEKPYTQIDEVKNIAYYTLNALPTNSNGIHMKANKIAELVSKINIRATEKNRMLRQTNPNLPLYFPPVVIICDETLYGGSSMVNVVANALNNASIITYHRLDSTGRPTDIPYVLNQFCNRKVGALLTTDATLKTVLMNPAFPIFPKGITVIRVVEPPHYQKPSDYFNTTYPLDNAVAIVNVLYDTEESRVAIKKVFRAYGMDPTSYVKALNVDSIVNALMKE